MNCRSAESLFSAFLDDELSQGERRHFESHLLGCRRCSQSLRELKAAMAVLADTAVAVETSPHFEDDVMERIRSGEAMRPTVIEWLQGFLAPVRLRPVLVVGASACAVVVAALVWHPTNRDDTTVASRETTPAPTAATTTPVVSEPAPAETAPVVLAQNDAASRATRPTRSNDGNGIVQIVDRVVPTTGTNAATDLSNPNSAFTDEYVTDQFYLQRGPVASDPQQPSLVPVTDKTAHDVYIEF